MACMRLSSRMGPCTCRSSMSCAISEPRWSVYPNSISGDQVVLNPPVDLAEGSKDEARPEAAAPEATAPSKSY